MKTLLRLLFISILLFLENLHGFAQKHNFTNYHIENGLIQSQANTFCQDRNHYLWISTLGGVSSFDGEKFTNYTRNNGLINNFSNTLMTDQKGNVWIGTQTGLSSFNGKYFTNIVFPDKHGNSVSHIAQSSDGTIWATAGLSLYKIADKKPVVVTVSSQTVPDTISCIAADNKGKLWAAVYKKGIYALEARGWTKKISLQPKQGNLFITDMLFDRNHEGSLWLLNRKAILYAERDSARPFQEALMKNIPEYYCGLEQDAMANLWIGCSKGAYCFDGKALKHYTGQNGLTDNLVQSIFRDAEDNLWFASDGSGIYRYSGDKYVLFDESQGIDNAVIMGISKEKNGKIWMGTYGGSLITYDGKTMQELHIPYGNRSSQRVNCLFTDSKDNTWIGTSGDGLWKYDGKNFENISGEGTARLTTVNDVSEDRAGTIWVSTPSTCYFFENKTLHPIKQFSRFSSTLAEVGRDSIFVGSAEGLFLIRDKKEVSEITEPGLASASVSCINKKNGSIFIGTSDRGLVIWDIVAKKLVNYTVKDGLNSDYIYSVLIDRQNNVWLGTGRGINVISRTNGKTTISAFGKVASECNQNAILQDDNGDIWIGTTKGAIKCNPLSKSTSYPPRVVLNMAKLIYKEKEDTIQPGARLRYDQNHLTFEFKGISLSDPEKIMYRYKLEGSENAYSAPSRSPFVVYPSLPPGKYTFKVKALSGEVESDNIAEFSFEIAAPYYSTGIFRGSLVLMFILTGVSLQAYRTRIKEREKQQIELLRAEEQQKIRQKTSEDFHDEMGNKLTRITVLSDILETQLQKEQEDQKKLIGQIKDNVAALYTGTKDILWSLQPESDNLYEILRRIRDFGMELFQETRINFSVTGLDEEFKQTTLPIDYSRNILMIFKESLNNALKHADCANVSIYIEKAPGSVLKITLKDDGKGFDTHTVKKGNGIGNIQVRAKRINGTMQVISGTNEGTMLVLQIKIPEHV